jgi:predicted nucleic acid-binding protein
MPIASLTAVPDGADLFLDANIFIYGLSNLSRQCEDLLSRCARQEVFGITSWDIIHEVTHRLMVAEAFRKGLIARARADDLRQRPTIVQALADYWSQVTQILNMNLAIIASEEAIARRAQDVRLAHGLLTLDSVLLATMEEYGLNRLASHDADFDRVTSLTVYHPGDIP